MEGTSVAVGCAVAWLVACLLRLFFGWAISEPPEAVTVGSGDRALLPDAFLAEVEEDLAPLAGFAVFWQCFVMVSTATRHHFEKLTFPRGIGWVGILLLWWIRMKKRKKKKTRFLLGRVYCVELSHR